MTAPGSSARFAGAQRALLAAGLVILTTIGGCANMFGFSSSATFSPDGLASYELPDGWNEREIVRTGTYALVEYSKTQARWFGAGDPLEVHAWVIIARADADEAAMQAAMTDGVRRVQGRTQEFPEFGSMKDGDRETWIHEGSYQIHSLHKPQQVTFVRSIDRVRRAGIVARVYTGKISHERLQKITRTFYSSLKITEKRTTYFSEIANWSAIRAARIKKERADIDAALQAEGLPPAQFDTTVVHGGWVYSLFERDFVIGRVLGSRTMATPGYGARGELSWLRYQGSEWESWRPSKASKPKRGAPYVVSDDALARWAPVFAPELDRSKAWFFAVKACRLTEEDWEEPRPPSACALAEWFPQAKRIESEFKVGALFVE
ncbi:MAG TPA: hypothetical protein VE869_14690 [Gemmatimonas sp.]|nr:hypothetical protein [Gemmatimonas sp.]